MAWWETEARSGSARQQFLYGVARHRARRLAAAAQAPAPPEQQTAAAALPPTQTVVQGGAFAQPATPTAIPYSQTTQPMLQAPQQIAMPPGVQDERLAELAPITPQEAIYTPKAQILREQVTGMIPKPWRGTPFHEWVVRGTIGGSHRLTEAFEKPTAKGTEPPPEVPEEYPKALQMAMKAVQGVSPPGAFIPRPGGIKFPWISGELDKLKAQWSKLERETGWADPVTRGLRMAGGLLNEADQFAKQHVGGSIVALHPEAEGLSEEQLYPLSESAGSLLFGPLLDALSAPDEDSDSIADLLGRLHDVVFPPGTELGQGLGPEYIGQVLKRVKAGEDSREVAADIYDPWAEVLLEAVVSPWNAFDVLELASMGKFLGKFGRSKQLMTAAEQAVLDPKFSKQAAKLATGYERLHDRQAAAVAAGLADTAKKAGVELSPEELGIIEKAWRGTLGLTPGSLADRDLNQTFKAGTIIFNDAKSGDEAIELAKRLVNDPDGLALTHGKNVQGQLGQKAQKVYAEILDEIPKFKSVKEGAFNPARFLLEFEDAARPAVEAIHGVKPLNRYQQMARHAKGIMGELYLSLASSFRYVISNFLVDSFTTGWNGINPFNRMSDVESWLERFGPTTLRAGGKDMREAIHGFRGRSNLPDWTGWLKRWSEWGMRETRHGVLGNIPVGEEPRYLAALKDQVEKFWNANAYKQIPKLPDELVQHLGPDLADDIRHAVSGGLNDDERRKALFRILDAQSPGEGIPYRKLLTPQEIDSIPREVHKHLDDEFSKLTMDSPAEELERIINEVQDKVADDVAERLDNLGDLLPSVVDSVADEEDLLDDVVENLTEAVERSGDPSLADEIPEIVEKKKQMADELAAATDEATAAAAELGSPDGIEILIAAARDNDDLLAANRKRLGRLRVQVVSDYRANPRNAKALWTDYFRQVDAAWTAHAMERHKRMVEATEQIGRLGEGEALVDILGKTQRELAEMRLRDISDLPDEVKNYIPASVLEDDEGKFEKFLNHRRAVVDQARAEAWRIGIGVDPEDYRATIDAWNAAGYDVDLAGRQAAGKVSKARAKAMTKADAAFAAGGKTAKLRAKLFWEEYYAARNAIWDEYFHAAENRWLKAQHNLMVQEYFKYAPPSPPVPKAAPVQVGDEELVKSATTKTPEERTPEELDALDRWTAKEPETPPPGEQPPLTPGAAQAPVPPAKFTRTQFRAALSDVVGYTDEEVEATMRISDARANTWAAETGRRPEEWYSEHIAGLESGEDFIAKLEEFAKTWTPPDTLKQAGVDYQTLRDALGASIFLDDGRTMIYAFKQADVSTIAHELGHIFRRELGEYDLVEATKWATGALDGVWDALAEEKFARAFERYLAEGSAPSPELAKVFERFKQWLTDIYKGITGSEIDVKMNDEIRGVFDRLLAEEPPARAGDIYGKELGYGRGLKAEEVARVADRHPLTVDTAMDEWAEYPDGEWGDWGGLRNLMEQRAEEYLRRSSPKELDALAYKFSHGGPSTERNIELMGFPAKTTRKRGAKAERQFRSLFYEGYTSPKAFYNEQKAIGEWYLDLAMQADELAKGKTTLTEITPPEWLKDISPYTAPTEESLRSLFQKAPEQEIWTPKAKPKQLGMFEAGEDLPLFTGTAPRGAVDEFAPEVAARQGTLPGMEQTPEEILAADKAKRAKKPPAAPEGQQALFQHLRNTAEPWFYKAEQLVSDNMPDQATVDQVQSILADGIKEDDLEWTGVARWLNAQEGTLSKEEVLSFLRGEQPLTLEDAQSLFQKAQETNDLQKAAGQPGATGTKPVGAEMMMAGEQDTRDALESLRRGLNDNWDQWQPRVADDAARRGLDDWLTKDVTPAMNDLRATSIEYGEGRVNDSLLDYSRRRGFDVGLSYLVPYNYWFTRTGYNWARRMTRRPGVLAHYLRYLNASKMMNEAAGRRKRFEQRRPISAEWLPDEMGDKLYVDPLRAMLPFAGLGMYNWDDADDSARGLRRVMNTANQAGFRMFPWVELPYQTGMVAKGAEALGMAPEKAQELYAPKRQGEFGYVLPQTGVIKGASAMAGIGPPGGINIEAPFRRTVGLPEGEVWDPYRVTRMLANMAGDAATDPVLARHVMNAQELAERWGQQGQQGRPWEPGDLIALSTARELNWTPEDLADAQTQLREGMNRAAQERGISTMSSLFTAMPTSIEPSGEKAQIELQRQSGEKLWSPEQPGGTRESYDQFRRDNPAIYARQAQYGTIPGEETEGFTPGQRGNWLAKKEAGDEINARYDAEMAKPGLTTKEKKTITNARYDELDEINERYPLPEIPDDMPPVRYGSSPEEAWDQLVEGELWDIKDGKPVPQDFMDGLQVRWTEYGDAVDEWEKSLPAAFGFGAVEGGKYAGMDPQQAYFLKWPKSTEDTEKAKDEEEGETKKTGYAATSGRAWYGQQAPRSYRRGARRRRPPIWTPRRRIYGGPFRG